MVAGKPGRVKRRCSRPLSVSQLGRFFRYACSSASPSFARSCDRANSFRSTQADSLRAFQVFTWQVRPRLKASGATLPAMTAFRRAAYQSGTVYEPITVVVSRFDLCNSFSGCSRHSPWQVPAWFPCILLLVTNGSRDLLRTHRVATDLLEGVGRPQHGCLIPFFTYQHHTDW